MPFDIWQPVNHEAESVKARLSWNTLSLDTQQGSGPLTLSCIYSDALIAQDALMVEKHPILHFSFCSNVASRGRFDVRGHRARPHSNRNTEATEDLKMSLKNICRHSKRVKITWRIMFKYKSPFKLHREASWHLWGAMTFLCSWDFCVRALYSHMSHML